MQRIPEMEESVTLATLDGSAMAPENNCRVEKLIKALQEQQHLIDRIDLRIENLEAALEQLSSSLIKENQETADRRWPALAWRLQAQWRAFHFGMSNLVRRAHRSIENQPRDPPKLAG
jgi:hypothetical protein